MPAPVSLLKLVDLSIGTPEVGAVNFRALRDLLLTIINKLNAANSSAANASDSALSHETNTKAPLRSSKTSVVSKSTLPELPEKSQYAEFDRDRAASMPTNAEIVHSIQHEKPLTDFWQFSQLTKRVESHDQGIEKLFHLVQDLIRDFHDLKQAHEDLQSNFEKAQTPHVIGKLDEIHSKVKDMDEIKQQLSNMQEDMSQYPPAEVVATWGGLEDALNGVQGGSESPRAAALSPSLPVGVSKNTALSPAEVAPKLVLSCPARRMSGAATPMPSLGSTGQVPPMPVTRKTVIEQGAAPLVNAAPVVSQPTSAPGMRVAGSQATGTPAAPAVAPATPAAPAGAPAAPAPPRKPSLRGSRASTSGLDGPSQDLMNVLARLGTLDERHAQVELDVMNLQLRCDELGRLVGERPARDESSVSASEAVNELSEELRRLRDRMDDLDVLIADVPVAGDPLVPPIGDKSRSNSLNMPSAAGAARLVKSANVPAQRTHSSVDNQLRNTNSDKKDTGTSSQVPGRETRDADTQHEEVVSRKQSLGVDEARKVTEDGGAKAAETKPLKARLASTKEVSFEAAKTHSLQGMSGTADRRVDAAHASRKFLDGGSTSREKAASQSMPSVEARDRRPTKNVNYTGSTTSESAVREPQARESVGESPILHSRESVKPRARSSAEALPQTGTTEPRQSKEDSDDKLPRATPPPATASRVSEGGYSKSPKANRFSSTLREVVHDDYMAEIEKLQRRMSFVEDLVKKVVDDLEDSHELELEEKIEALSGQFTCNLQDLSKRLDDAEASLKDLPYPYSKDADGRQGGAAGSDVAAVAPTEQADALAIKNAQKAILAMQEELQKLQHASSHLAAECKASDEVQTEPGEVAEPEAEFKKKEKTSQGAFSIVCTDLQRNVADLLTKLKAYEDAWKSAHGRLEASVGSKLDRSELDRLRGYIDEKLRSLQKGFKRATGIVPDFCFEAALLKRRLTPFSCLSCDKPVLIERARSDRSPVLAVPVKTAVELEHCPPSFADPSSASSAAADATGQSGLPLLTQQALSQMKDASALRAYLVHYGQRVSRGGPKVFITRSKQRVLCPGGADAYGRPRSCGGRYTALRPPKKKVATIKDILTNEDLVAVGNFTKIEEDIEGADGLLYKGRNDVIQFEPTQLVDAQGAGATLQNNLPCTPYSSTAGPVLSTADGSRDRPAEKSLSTNVDARLLTPVAASDNASCTSAASAPAAAGPRPTTPLTSASGKQVAKFASSQSAK